MDIQSLQTELISYLLAKGSCNYVENRTVSHIPITLLPTIFPKQLFQFGKEVSTIYAELVDKIVRNDLIIKQPGQNWLINVLKETGKVDDFVRRHLELFEESLELRKSNPESYQELQLGILRSDYMIHTEDNKESLLQVELNTMASGLGTISADVTRGHQNISKRFPDLIKQHDNKFIDFTNSELVNSIIPNEGAESVSFAMFRAEKEFIKSLCLSPKEKAFYKFSTLMIVLQVENNEFDQRQIQFGLYEKYNVEMIRKTLKEVEKEGKYIKIGDKENILEIDGFLISVVYFRSGYSPSQYPSDDQWNARKKIELSFSIKCPSIGYHLAGKKKVQQCYSDIKQVLLFLNKEKSDLLEKSFAKIYSLDENEMTKETKEIVIKLAMKSEDFVLKPQREGGGNNYFGLDVGKKLKEMTTEELKGFILMQRIYPKPTLMHLINRNCLKLGEGVSELGLFSIFMSNGKETLFNEYGGYLLRNKFKHIKEGGVAKGYSCLGSLSLK